MRKLITILMVSYLFSFGIYKKNNFIVENPEVVAKINLLKSWIESQMAYNDWPGISIGIVYDQELIWSKGFGHQNQ